MFYKLGMDFKELMERLKSKYENQPHKPDTAIYCPECGNPMIKRASNWGGGFWWGCSLFPKCRGKRNK